MLVPQEMTAEEKAKISDLKKCDFNEMADYFKAQSEARKAKSKEEKQVSTALARELGHSFHLLSVDLLTITRSSGGRPSGSAG